jgi:hypothetical protein
MNKGRLTSLVRLSYLGPEIVRALLAGSQSNALTPSRLLRLSKNLPHDWKEQRRFLRSALSHQTPGAMHDRANARRQRHRHAGPWAKASASKIAADAGRAGNHSPWRSGVDRAADGQPGSDVISPRHRPLSRLR